MKVDDALDRGSGLNLYGRVLFREMHQPHVCIFACIRF